MFRRSLTFAAAAAAFALLAGSASAGGIQESQLVEAKEAVSGAQADLADARTYLSELKNGDFAGIFAVADDGSMRCGEVEANSACAPLTAQDKADAIAEAEEMVNFAIAQSEDAAVALASLKGVNNAAMASAE